MLSTYFADKLLEHGVGKTSYTMPTTFFGLFVTYPTGPGDTGTEGSGGFYVRLATSGLWAAAASGKIANNAEVDITGNAQTYTGMGIWDASTSGNWLAASELGVPVTNESVVLSSGLGATAFKPCGNVVVKDSSATTTYVEGTDYYFLRDAGVIARISTGGIGASDTLKISYNKPGSVTLPTDGSKVFFNSGDLFLQLIGFQA